MATMSLPSTCFQVEGAHQHHRPIKPDEQPGIGGEGREPSMDRAVRGEIAAVAHLEARDHWELFVCAAAFGHAPTPSGNSFDQQ
jgi:hypothetical protein